jgi:tetratricopeptide (TPR) repeat protein/transglutaminase-like putative cysteine protease
MAQQPSLPPPGSADKQAPATQSQSATSVAQAPVPPDYSQQAFVVEQFRQTLRFENDGTGREEQEARIKVTSESGVQALGQLKVGYSAQSDQLEIVYVRVRKPDGTVVTAQDSAIQDLTIPDAPVYTDYHQKHISVPSLRPGDTLEFRYVRTIVNPLIPGQFWTAHNFTAQGIVLEEQVEIDIPKNRDVKLKTQPGFAPEISSEGDRRVYRWTHSRTSEDEASVTKRKRPDPEEPPSIEMTTFQSWEQLGDWYGALEKDRRQPTEVIKAKADSLVAGKTDDMSKVKALYDYVSRDFRYVSLSLGLSRYQPHAATEVLSVGYGDCKDKNTLLAALLAAEGFNSSSVLINAERNVDPDIPSPSQFNHVITRVPVSGQEIWLDSTSGVAPFRMLSLTLRGKEALVIPPDGKPGLVRTPADLPFPAFDHSRIDGEISDTGRLKAHLSTSIRGDAEMSIRYAFRQIPSNHWKDLLQASLQDQPLRGAEISNLHVGDPMNTDIPIQIEYDISVGNYFDWSAAEPRLPLPIGEVRIPTAESESSKSKPIKLGSPQEVRAEVSLAIPNKYTVQMPIGVDVKRDYGEYHSSYKVLDNRLVAIRTLTVRVADIPAERGADYTAFARVLDSDQAQVIRLENKSPGMGSAPGSGTPDELFDAGVQALNNRNYEVAVQLLERVQVIDPLHKGVWKMLGRAYLASDQPQKAVEAYQRQIAANPYDESAYTELGTAYERQQKYDEAIAQFKKQLEVNPLDAAAHASLGVLYVTLKRFGDAIPELEKAASVQPNNPLLQVSLGQAYLGADQTQRGIALFEKAIAMSPTPVVWNNIAYALAEQKVDLKRAEAYADAAISASETQLRDVSLANLKFQDLGTTHMLFSVWDTKGWVLFKQGELEKAEAYIQPAWQGSASGDVAEHLGEIAEMRGNRDQAIRYYAMSLATDSPSASAQEKLSKLGVSGAPLEKQISNARKDMLSERTTKLSNTQVGAADFFLLVDPTKIEDAKFVKGEQSLQAFTPVMKTVPVPMKFPPSSQVHVVRRARLSCGEERHGKTDSKQGNGAAFQSFSSGSSGSALPGPCTLEWIPSSQVRSID